MIVTEGNTKLKDQKIRKELGLSYQDLANIFKSTKQTIQSSINRPKRSYFSMERLAILFKFFRDNDEVQYCEIVRMLIAEQLPSEIGDLVRSFKESINVDSELFKSEVQQFDTIWIFTQDIGDLRHLFLRLGQVLVSTKKLTIVYQNALTSVDCDFLKSVFVEISITLKEEQNIVISPTMLMHKQSSNYENIVGCSIMGNFLLKQSEASFMKKLHTWCINDLLRNQSEHGFV